MVPAVMHRRDLVGGVEHTSPAKVEPGAFAVGSLHFVPSLQDAQHPSDACCTRAGQPGGKAMQTASLVRILATPIGHKFILQKRSNQQSNDISDRVKQH